MIKAVFFPTVLHFVNCINHAVRLLIVFVVISQQPAIAKQDLKHFVENVDQKKIRIHPCWFEVPKGRAVTCGTYVTQSQTAVGDPVNFELPVVVIHDRNNRSAEPLVFLSGGPGNSTYLEADVAGEWIYWFDTAGLKRDLILVDQRGTGLSKPQFRCEHWHSDFIAALQRPLPIKADSEIAFNSLEQCLKAVIQSGFSPEAFTTTQSAMDMHGVVAALGYNKVNIFGGSYGTRLALEWYRLYPEQVAHLVLDSVYPPDKGDMANWVADTDKAFRNFWQSYDYNRVLENRFWQLAKRMDEKPITLFVSEWASEKRLTVVVTQHRFIDIVFNALYTPSLHSVILDMLDDLAKGDTESLRYLTEEAVNAELATEFNPLTFFAVECQETKRISAETFEKSRQAFPQWNDYSEFAWEYDGCRLFNERQDLANFKQVIVEKAGQAVPVLLLSGGIDPVTPAAWAFQLEETLQNVTHWHYPKASHGITSTKPCALKAIEAFLADNHSGAEPRCD